MFCIAIIIAHRGNNGLYVHSIDVIPEEGGTNVELISGGRNIEVTTNNVYDYVRKYAEYRMVKSQEKALQVNCAVIHY